jgi:hypothetical protein
MDLRVRGRRGLRRGPLAGCLALVLLFACAGPASATEWLNSASIKVPGSGDGPGAANPYPSTISLSGIPGTVLHVRVILTGFTHRVPADVDVLVVAPGGQKTLVMSDGCGTAQATGLTLTFDDPSPLLLNSNCVSGSYRPTDFDGNENVLFPPPAPPGPYPVALSTLNGSPANGTWQLFVQDDSNDASGAIADNGSVSGGWAVDVLPSVTCAGETATLSPYVGYPYADVMQGTPGHDVILGLGGDDHIHGFSGNDFLCGGDGRDVIKGGLKKDTLKGGTEADRLVGGPGDDTLLGGGGSDHLNGGPGFDVCKGGSGKNLIQGCEGGRALRH